MHEKRRILIVDDNPELLNMCSKVLLPTGDFEVREEINGANAITAALEFRPELILLDRFMPMVDGFILGQEIMRNEELREVPVVLMTASITQTQADSGMMRPLPVLVKPFWPGALLNCVRRFLPVVEKEGCARALID